MTDCRFCAAVHLPAHRKPGANPAQERCCKDGAVFHGQDFLSSHWKLFREGEKLAMRAESEYICMKKTCSLRTQGERTGTCTDFLSGGCFCGSFFRADLLTGPRFFANSIQFHIPPTFKTLPTSNRRGFELENGFFPETSQKTARKGPKFFRWKTIQPDGIVL